MFGKLQQRKEAIHLRKRWRGKTERYKKEECEQRDNPTNRTAAVALSVNYSREKEQDRTKKEVERKDRKIQKGRECEQMDNFTQHATAAVALLGKLQQRKEATHIRDRVGE